MEPAAVGFVVYADAAVCFVADLFRPIRMKDNGTLPFVPQQNHFALADINMERLDMANRHMETFPAKETHMKAALTIPASL